MSEQESVVTEPSLPTPGQLLKAARQAKELSLEQVASKINLRAHNIEAIENDEDDSNLSTTFTKGYLKLYAKFVDVSESDVLQAFERMNSVVKEPAKLQSFSRRVAKQTSDARLMMVTYFIIAIVIALSVLWWFQQSKETAVIQAPLPTPSIAITEQESVIPQTSAPTLNDPPSSAEESVIEDGELLVGQISDLTEITEDGAPIVDDIEALADDVSGSAIGEQAAAGTNEEQIDPVAADDILTETIDNTEDDAAFDSFAIGEVELIFEFADDCWVSVVDSTGETIAIGVKKSGYVMTVPGIPPFEVTLGAPQAVQISMAGDTVDMTRFPAGRTAKFELPLQE
jgi:cytoskeleton protein RodZ